jgi:hypothetical protein
MDFAPARWQNTMGPEKEKRKTISNSDDAASASHRKLNVIE